MGVCYELICTKCKKRLDIGKSRGIYMAWDGTINEHCLSLWPGIVAFMRRHWGHDCEIISDHDEPWHEAYGIWEKDDVTRPPAQT